MQRFTVFDADAVCAGSGTLLICEGPLDAIAVWLASDGLDVAGTALFGAWASPLQLAILLGLRRRYRRMYVMLDADALGKGMELAMELDVGVIDVGQERDDPAAMPVRELRELVTYVANSGEPRVAWPLARRNLACR
jgi:hypothetical protein